MLQLWRLVLCVQDKLVLDGRSWTLAEVPHDYSSSMAVAVAQHHHVARPDPPAVVSQHAQIDRQFVIINSKVTSRTLSTSILADISH